MKRDYIPGSTIWVVERDDWDIPTEVTGYMFLACVADYAILTPFIGELETLSETLADIAETCKEKLTADLIVLSLMDCYTSRDTAEAAMQEELADTDEEGENDG